MAKVTYSPAIWLKCELEIAQMEVEKLLEKVALLYKYAQICLTFPKHLSVVVANILEEQSPTFSF